MRLITAEIGEVSFIKQINTGCFNHTPGQTPGPDVDDQHKIHPMFIAWFSCLFLLSLVFCLFVLLNLFVLIFVVFSIFFFFLGARSLLGNDIGSIWEEFEEGKEYDQNKFYKISLLNESNPLHSKFSWFLNSFWIDI